MDNTFIICALATSLAMPPLYAQVTIGMDAPPAKAALLDIKTQQAINPPAADDGANVTSVKGGILPPRVKLKDPATLEPFITVTDPEWMNGATTKVKELHAGLMVYNLTDNQSFKPGLYVWDGNRWNAASGYYLHTGNGLSRTGDSIRLGGSLDRETKVDMGALPFAISGAGAMKISAPLAMSKLFKYVHGQPGKGKVIISDVDGNASWQNNNALATPPSATFSTGGKSFNPDDVKGDKWIGSGATLIIPPGKWFVSVTMFMRVLNGSSVDDLFWVRSTFIRAGDALPDEQYFLGKNTLISARIRPGQNIISGYVLMNNKTSSPLSFEYNVGRVEHLSGSSSCTVDKFGSSDWGENTIVAFALY